MQDLNRLIDLTTDSRVKQEIGDIIIKRIAAGAAADVLAQRVAELEKRVAELTPKAEAPVDQPTETEHAAANAIGEPA